MCWLLGFSPHVACFSKILVGRDRANAEKWCLLFGSQVRYDTVAKLIEVEPQLQHDVQERVHAVLQGRNPQRRVGVGSREPTAAVVADRPLVLILDEVDIVYVQTQTVCHYSLAQLAPPPCACVDWGTLWCRRYSESHVNKVWRLCNTFTDPHLQKLYVRIWTEELDAETAMETEECLAFLDAFPVLKMCKRRLVEVRLCFHCTVRGLVVVVCVACRREPANEQLSHSAFV